MAITTTITKSAGWARTDVIDQLEQGFTWLELHGSRISGLVTSVSSFSGGGTVGSSNTTYYDVPVATTSGIGTGASFDVFRSNGSVYSVAVNRPGYGYTSGEYLTISAADIGGETAVAIGVTVLVEGGASPVGYGSTNQFFDKNLSPSNDPTRPWAVLKQDFDTNKRFGVTYRGFKVASDYQLDIFAGSSFFPFDTTNINNNGGQTKNSFRGMFGLDTSFNNLNNATTSLDAQESYFYPQINGTNYNEFNYATTNSPTTHNLNLNIYRSSIDPKFAVLSFSQPSVSGAISDSTFSTFIIHNFNSNLWNLDEVFSAGITLIDRDPSLNSDGADTGIIAFKTYLTGNRSFSTPYSFRTAEAGWSQYYGSSSTIVQNYNIVSSQSNYTQSSDGSFNNIGNHVYSSATIYSRTGGFKDKGALTSQFNFTGNRYPITTYNAVIKGIPINGNLIPCPYYMPDDFVVIDFRLAASGQDIKQGDTITISGSEVYTVITGSYNKFGETAGVLFCARTV